MLITSNSKGVRLGDTVHGQRNSRFLEGIQSFIDSQAKKREIELAESEDRRNMQMRELAESAVNMKHVERRREREDQLHQKKALLEQTLVMALSEIYVESLVFDSDYMIDNGDSIRENASAFYQECFKQGVLTIGAFASSPSPTVRDIYRACEHVAVAVVNEGADQDEALNLFTALVESAATTVATTVKKKVTEVVKREREIEAENEELEASLTEAAKEKFLVKSIKEASLFRSIMYGTVKLAKEGTDVDMRKVFAESVAMYTALESLNTMRLSTLRPRHAQDLCRQFSSHRIS
jgi:hypothetical protein